MKPIKTTEYFRAERLHKEEWCWNTFGTWEEALERYERDKAKGKYPECRIVKESIEIFKP